jgi:hypothetical protein
MTTIATLPTYNPAQLAEALRDRGLPGRRSKTAIIRLRRERARRREALQVQPPTLKERLHRRLVATYAAEIARRGGETAIDTDRDRQAGLQVVDRRDTLTLLHRTAWRYYSRTAKPRLASLSYLCGHEHGQPWAVRVPGTITTVTAALVWVTPAAVRDARAADRPVWRQGDVYAVATTKRHDGTGELPERHAWNPASRLLSHPEHGQLHLPDPVRFMRQNAYSMGRGAGRGFAD